MVETKSWNVGNVEDIYEMLHFISGSYGDECSKCKTSCCANQMLEVHSDDLKAMAKHLKMQPSEFRLKYTKTKENYIKDLGGKIMSQRGKDMMMEPGRVIAFMKSDDMTLLPTPLFVGGKLHKEAMTTYCPFYEKEAHRCKVHDARPKACRNYPFLRVDSNTLEVRKVTMCVITDRFLERFIEFLSGVDIPPIQAYVENTKAELEKKEYFNHFYLPWELVLIYLSYEFAKRGMRGLAVDLMKRFELEKQVMIMKMDREAK
jgi:Fe-S-cluster containining protein